MNEKDQSGRKMVRTSRFVTDDHAVFDKWTQALGSPDELIRTSHGHATEHEPAFVITLPVVVVPDNTLWTVEYHHENGQMKPSAPKQSDTVMLFVATDYVLSKSVTENPLIPYCVSHLHFFTLTGFRNIVRILGRGDGFLYQKLFPADRIQPQIASMPTRFVRNR